MTTELLKKKNPKEIIRMGYLYKTSILKQPTKQSTYRIAYMNYWVDQIKEAQTSHILY